MNTDFIDYSDAFNEFLDKMGDKKSNIVKEALNKFVKGDLDVKPRDCQHYDGRVKIMIEEAKVVVYFDKKDDRIVMIDGNEVHDRAA